MKSGGVPREEPGLMKLLLISPMEMHGFNQTSSCDRAKGRRGNLSGRGETRKTTDVTLDSYTLCYSQRIWQQLIRDLKIII